MADSSQSMAAEQLAEEATSSSQQMPAQTQPQPQHALPAVTSVIIPPTWDMANKENRMLEEQLRSIENALEDTDKELQENGDRITVMAEHLTNVQHELKHTQNRLESKTREIKTEDHLKQLSKREAARLERDVSKLQRERAELRARAEALQIEIFKGGERMDQFKLLMNWNQEEFEQWALASRQKEEDNAALARYQKQDDARVKELTMQLEKVSKDMTAMKQAVATEVTETQAAQIELDRTAEDYRQLHRERQALLAQWDEAREAMRRRDEAIQLAGAKYAEKKRELAALKEALDAQAQFLDNEQANNREVEGKIQAFEREVGRLRDGVSDEAGKLAAISDEVQLLRNTLSKTQEEMDQQKNTGRHLREFIESKKARLAVVQRKCAAAKERLTGEVEQLGSLESRVQELEDLRKVEEARLVALEKELRGLKTEQFRKGQQLFALRSREKECISEIAGAQAQSHNLQDKLNRLEQQVSKQEEMLYNVEFQLQMMERKVARAGGERSDQETRALNARIAKLTTQLEAVNAEHSMLTAQLKKVEDDLGRARRHNQEQKREARKVEDGITQMRLENELTQRALKALVQGKEERLVEHDVLALEVRRLRAALAQRADEVLGLENRRSQLQLSMAERKQEIEVHREALAAEVKAVREDCHRVTLELTERAQRAAVLEAKFGTMVARTRGADGESEEHSQAYYVIKAAQEREELQREGDALDKQIRVAEEELAGLEVALGGLEGTNSAMTSALRPADDSDAAAAKASIRQQADHAYDLLKQLREEERLLEEDCAQAEARADSLRGESQGREAVLADLNLRKAEAERGLDEQREKERRARRRMEKLRKDLRDRAAPELPQGALPEQERDIALAGLHAGLAGALDELAALQAQVPELDFEALLVTAGMRLPQPGGGSGKGGSGSGSLRSSRSGSSWGGLSQEGSVKSAISRASSTRSSVSGRLGERTPPMRQIQL